MHYSPGTNYYFVFIKENESQDQNLITTEQSNALISLTNLNQSLEKMETGIKITIDELSPQISVDLNKEMLIEAIVKDNNLITKKENQDDPHYLFAYNFSMSIENMMKNPSMEKQFHLAEKLNGKLCETESQFTSTSSLVQNDEVVYDDSLQDDSFESDR